MEAGTICANDAIPDQFSAQKFLSKILLALESFSTFMDTKMPAQTHKLDDRSKRKQMPELPTTKLCIYRTYATHSAFTQFVGAHQKYVLLVHILSATCALLVRKLFPHTYTSILELQNIFS